MGKKQPAQARRYLPMPDFSLEESNLVRLTVYGGVVDPAYTRLLMQKTGLPFTDILALDRVQKNLPLPDEMIRHLRRARLVEGRKPNLHVSASIAEATNKKAEYIKTRALDDDYYAKLITDFIDKYGKASRKDIDDLLFDKLSGVLDEKKKVTKIGNLISKLRMSSIIYNTGTRSDPEWRLCK